MVNKLKRNIVTIFLKSQIFLATSLSPRLSATKLSMYIDGSKIDIEQKYSLKNPFPE